MEAIFPVNKPVGLTSHDVVAMIKAKTGERRVGHAGTLDPLAEGVLVIAVGRAATKRLAEIVSKEKEYEADIRLGMTSTTDDAEGVKSVHSVASVPKRSDIERVILNWQGIVSQTPPAYSALKVGGRRAYKLARTGKTNFLRPRSVEIRNLVIMAYDWPVLSLRVTTGPGVYIRALARDIGEGLGVGGYLEHLCRVRVGDFRLSGAQHLRDVT